MNKNLEFLEDYLNKLKIFGGLISFSIGDYYIQIIKEDKEDSFYFEAVSFYFLDIIPKKSTKLFKRIGFKIDKGNFFKYYKIEDISTIMHDTKIIFENIFQINFELPFEVNDNINYPNNNSSNSENKQSVKNENNNNSTIKFLIIIGLLIVTYFLFFYNNNDSTNHKSNYDTNNDASYIIKEEAFATFNKEDFDEMYTYFVQKDTKAVESMLQEGKILVIPQGTEVFLMEAHFGYNVVRQNGSTIKLWISSERMSKK